jgi:NTP pyrophosphatase (non-canonical NTP hydrolase)
MRQESYRFDKTLTRKGGTRIGRIHFNDTPAQKFTNHFPHSLMTIEEAQKLVDGWIKTTGVRYFNELTNMAMLTEEVGEVARIIARQYGEQSFKESDKGKNLADELADVLFVVICLANQTGVDLTEALNRNLEKKNVRDATRHLNNEKLKG